MEILKRGTSLGKYIDEIDGLRFIAIFSVILMHLSERIRKYNNNFDEAEYANYFEYLVSRGTVGVFLFFAISGFILALPFAKNMYMGRTQRPYKSYIQKRLFRIEPPYVFWMTVFFITLVISSNASFTEQLGHYLASLFYLHNIIFSEYSTINPVAWSLEVELQFYLLAPFLVKAIFSISNDRLRRMAMMAILTIYPFIENVLHLHEMPFKASLLGYFDFFLIGFIVVDIYLTQKELLESRSRIWDVVFLVSLFAMFTNWSSDWGHSVIMNLSILGVLISAFKGQITNKIMRNKWLTITGGMCYTIYLIHLPLFELIASNTTKLFGTSSFLLELLGQSLISLPILAIITIIAFLGIEKPFMTKSSGSQEEKSSFSGFQFAGNYILKAKKAFTAIFITLVLLLTSGHVIAQTEQNYGADILKVDLEDPGSVQLLPLEMLGSMAEANSPLLKTSNYSIENLHLELGMLKTKWTEYLSVTASYIYGTSSYLDQSETVFNVDYSTLNRKSLFYHAGVTLRLPISEVLTRGQRAKMINNEMKILELQREEFLVQIRKSLIHYYNSYNSKMEILKIRNDQLQSIEMSSKFADEALLNGQLDIVEYNKVKAAKAQLLEEIEITKSEITLAFLMLCELTGQNVRI